MNARITLPFLIFLSFATLLAQNTEGPGTQNALKTEILEHYKKYDIGEIQSLYDNLEQDIPLGLLKLQNLQNSFYRDFPRSMPADENINLDVTLHRQEDPDYKLNAHRETALEKLKEIQTPGLIANAPNIFEMHFAMARGLVKAEKSGGLFTKNPVRAAYHYLAAMRYRTLKLSPEVWTDPQRLVLLGNAQEKKDADEYLRISNELASARQNYATEKKKLYAAEDNAVRNLKDPGFNEPMRTQNNNTLNTLLGKIDALQNEMSKQNEIYQSYEKTYNQYSAAFLLDFALVIDSIDSVIQDREKILNAIEYYRTNYNETYRQNWKLESRKLAYIGLLEMASELHPLNPMIPFILGREYKNTGDNLLAISSFEKALKSHESSLLKLSITELKEIYNQLGGLYYSSNRFVDSAFYYEKVLSLESTPDLIFQLARIHTEKTGNYDRADALLKDLLKEAPPVDGGASMRADFLRNRFQILSLQITVYEKKDSQSELLETLNQSAQIHRELQDLIQNSYDALRIKEKQMIGSRIALNQSPDEKNLQSFYQTQQDYQDQKDVLQKLESTRKTLNFSKIYFTMAWQYELHHDIDSAIDTYRKAESFGFDPDRARKEISRLQKEFR